MEAFENKGFVYEFGKFVLDPEEKTLFSNGTPLHLPAKEFETLLLLVENNGRALSKDEMLTAIWHDSYVEEGNLAKQISRLRKIFNTNDDQFIETLPKHGYRFKADLRKTVHAPDESMIVEKRTVKRLTLDVEQETSETQPAPRRSTRQYFAAKVLAGLAAVVLLGAATVWFWSQRTRPPARIASIAVLPLRSLTNEENNKALGLGLTDALITKLGSLRQIIVRPTSAVTPFANVQQDSIEIGKKLGVDAVLEGTIQQSEGRLRINARLIKTDSGQQIWAEKFDEPAGGIFALQDALSAKIAKTLAFELTKADNEALARRGTDNAEAYEKFLIGRFYQTQNTSDGLNRSIEFYQQAIALDPSFAEAHAGIADANVILFNFGIRPAAETIPQARQSVSRALQLNPDLSNAHASIALIQFLIERNWTDAEKSLQRAIELNTNNADAYHRYGYFLTRVGRFDEALEKYEKARELNPLSNVVQSGIGLTYLCARRYPEAIEQLERTAAENPQFAHPQWLLGISYEAAGDLERAFAANLKALEIEGGADFAVLLRNVHNAEGLEAANRLWFEESVKVQNSGQVSPLLIAMRAATVKDREQTLYWLERSLEEGDTTIGGIKFLAKFDFVRDEPRFQAVVQKMSF